VTQPLVQFRCAPDLIERIEEAAADAGMDKSTWLRLAVASVLDADYLGPPVDEPLAPEPVRRTRPSVRECVHPPARRRGAICGLCGGDLGAVTFPRVGSL
jgi:hypothetical protein